MSTERSLESGNRERMEVQEEKAKKFESQGKEGLEDLINGKKKRSGLGRKRCLDGTGMKKHTRR